jgi:hypothetical protein
MACRALSYTALNTRTQVTESAIILQAARQDDGAGLLALNRSKSMLDDDRSMQVDLPQPISLQSQ